MADSPVVPEELLQNIFSFLQQDGSELDFERRRTLATICRVSKQCHRLAQPLLYHTVHVSADDHSIQHVWETAIRKPHLAKLVRWLYVQGWEFDDGTRPEPRQDIEHPVTDELLSIIDRQSNYVKPLFGPFWDHISRTVKLGHESSILAYLFVVCSEIHYLHLTLPHNWAPSNAGCALRYFHRIDTDELRKTTWDQPEETPIPTSALPHLRELYVEHWDTENAAHIDDIIPLWDIKSVEVFRGHMIDCTVEGIPMGKVNNIREMHLTQSLVNAPGFQLILELCPKLEVLNIEWGSATVGSTDDYPYHAFGALLRSRLKEPKLLTKLVLEPDDQPDWMEVETVLPPLGPLKVLTSLEHLGVTAMALIGEDDELEDNYPNFESPSLLDVLPESLVCLEIFSCREEETEDFDRKLFEVMTDGRYQPLSTIIMHRAEDFTELDSSLEDSEWKVSDKHPYCFVLKRTSTATDAEF